MSKVGLLRNSQLWRFEWSPRVIVYKVKVKKGPKKGTGKSGPAVKYSFVGIFGKKGLQEGDWKKWSSGSMTVLGVIFRKKTFSIGTGKSGPVVL